MGRIRLVQRFEILCRSQNTTPYSSQHNNGEITNEIKSGRDIVMISLTRYWIAIPRNALEIPTKLKSSYMTTVYKKKE